MRITDTGVSGKRKGYRIDKLGFAACRTHTLPVEVAK